MVIPHTNTLVIIGEMISSNWCDHRVNIIADVYVHANTTHINLCVAEGMRNIGIPHFL